MYMYQILQAGLERMESVHAGFRFGMTKKYSCIVFMSNTGLYDKTKKLLDLFSMKLQLAVLALNVDIYIFK